MTEHTTTVYSVYYNDERFPGYRVFDGGNRWNTLQEARQRLVDPDKDEIHRITQTIVTEVVNEEEAA